MTGERGAARHVSCWLTFELASGTELALQVAPSTGAGTITAEDLQVTIDGRPEVSVSELAVDHGGRVHLLAAPAGSLQIAYSATVEPAPAVLGPPDLLADGFPVTDAEVAAALRPSAYCRSDELNGYARRQFTDHLDDPRLAHRVAAFVFERIAYTPGSSRPLDGAADTLLANAGVCRDFAHLTIGLCRALGIPTRLAAVYAPGLSPMDFHAVVEARTLQGWEVLDATRLAPRQSLVRIATGHDAAHTAFASTIRGNADLVAAEVVAYVDGDLPLDDHEAPVALA
jgi:transglutaminase-like putative cysteine protease